MLTAARDYEAVFEKAGDEDKQKPALIPELFAALTQWGRELRRGEVGSADFAAAVPDTGDVTRDGCILTLADAGDAPPLERFLSEGAQDFVAERWFQQKKRLTDWNALLHSQGQEVPGAAAVGQEAAAAAELAATAAEQAEQEAKRRKLDKSIALKDAEAEVAEASRAVKEA